MAIDFLIIPRYLVTVRFIELPSTNEQEIRDMIEFQALKEVPYARDEIVIGYKNFTPYKDGFSYIMLIIAKKDALEEIMVLKEQKVEHMRLSTEVVYESLLKNGMLKDDKVTMVARIKKDDAELMVIDKARIVLSRGFKDANELTKELDASIRAYKRDNPESEIGEIIIVYKDIRDSDELKPVMQKYSKAPVILHELHDIESGTELPLEIELLPAIYIDKRVAEETKKGMFLMYVLIGVIVAISCLFFACKVHEKHKMLDMCSATVALMQDEIHTLNSLSKKTEILKTQKERGEFIVRMLEDSYNAISNNIAISGLEYDGRESLFYKGMTLDMPHIFNAVKILEGSRYFKKVEIKYATKKDVKDQELIDFNIACTIK